MMCQPFQIPNQLPEWEQKEMIACVDDKVVESNNMLRIEPPFGFFEAFK